jgi:hypothetical protein
MNAALKGGIGHGNHDPRPIDGMQQQTQRRLWANDQQFSGRNWT